MRRLTRTLLNLATAVRGCVISFGKRAGAIVAILLVALSCAPRQPPSREAPPEASANLPFWPDPEPEPYPWPPRVPGASPPDDSGLKLLTDRWDKGVDAPSGSAADEVTIRSIVMAHLRADAGQTQGVGRVRWLSADEVMVEASWYSGSLAAASYIYVVQRRPHGWHILHRYMLGVA